MFFRTPAEPPVPEPDLTEQEAAVAAFSNGLLEIRQLVLKPAFDAADGIRADLIARGWSAQAAEVIAVPWLQRVLNDTHSSPGGSQ